MLPTTNPSSDHLRKRNAVSTVLFLWGLLRLPVLVIALYLFRNAVLAAIEQKFDIAGITEYTIAVMSTLVARGIIFVALIALGLFFWALFTWRLGRVVGYIVTVLAVGVVLFIAFTMTKTMRISLVPVMLVLATNLLPDEIINRWSLPGRWRNWLMAVGIGIAEVFFLRRYIIWLVSLVLPGQKSLRLSFILQVLPGLVLTAGLVGALLNHGALVSVEQSIRMTPTTTIFDRGDFNWIEVDASGQYLFATGNGAEYLQRYDLADLTASPLLSSDPTDGAQGFAYDPIADEIYVYDSDTQQLLYFDADTLKLKRAVPLPDVSPGDAWISVDDRTDTLTIVSEADIQTGAPFVLVDRSSGAVLDRRNLDAGNLLMHPDKPLLYMSFFRRTSSLLAYDLEKHEVAAEMSTEARVDRMVFWKPGNEVLLASPVDSQVLRFDADTLQPKGSLSVIFGVRVLAIDPTRNLLLCGSLTTGMVAVYDLTTGAQQQSFYLGPWLRTIALNPTTGMAYVSSNGMLYAVKYVK